MHFSIGLPEDSTTALTILLLVLLASGTNQQSKRKMKNATQHNHDEQQEEHRPPSGTTSLINGKMKRPSIILATRIHLGKQSKPPEQSKLRDILTSFLQTSHCIQAAAAAAAKTVIESLRLCVHTVHEGQREQVRRSDANE
jgi:hypothetical protein